MKTFRFKKLDAFAAGRSGGNPAGAVYLDSPADISGDEMLRIARELKGFVSEVGFLSKEDGGLFRLRYYSSECEVAFCGHATVALLYDLIANDKELLQRGEISIDTRRGRLAVRNRITQEDAVFIEAPKPVYADRTVDAQAVADALRIDAAAIDGDQPISILNAGLETLIVPIRSLDDILSIAPDFGALKRFCIELDVDIITVLTGDTANPHNAYRTRVFAPTFGYLEDPATGSGNSAFGYYLLANRIQGPGLLTLEQNGDRENPNIIKLELGERDGEPQVRFGGGAVARIEGVYRLV